VDQLFELVRFADAFGRGFREGVLDERDVGREGAERRADPDRSVRRFVLSRRERCGQGVV
jgi:hypothetical protein